MKVKIKVDKPTPVSGVGLLSVGRYTLVVTAEQKKAIEAQGIKCSAVGGK